MECYCAMSKICKGRGKNMLPYFGDICVGEAYHIYSSIMSHFLYLK